MTGPATFSLFVRRLPADRGFLVAAGLADCLRFLEDFHFDDVDLHYLRDQLGFDRSTLDAFAALRFTGDVHAVPEGEVVGADEPLLEVTARRRRRSSWRPCCSTTSPFRPPSRRRPHAAPLPRAEHPSSTSRSAGRRGSKQESPLPGPPPSRDSRARATSRRPVGTD
ncbi:hypothetical protein ACU686_09420 [Yinghuangia aomiensis]